jgi:AraC-like DNA-binding protein
MRVKKERINLVDQSLRFSRVGLDTFWTELHRHAQLQLTWVEQGAGVRLLGDSAEPFESGDLVLVGSDLPHAWLNAGTHTAPPSVASVMQFSSALFAQTSLPELSVLQPLAVLARRGLLITGPTHEHVVQRMSGLRDADALQRLLGLIDILRQLTLRPQDLRPVASTTAVATNGQFRRIDRVIQWVHAHLSESLSMQEAASVAHVTPAAFSRFFRRETGKTYTRYVNDLRCAEACVLLRRSVLPVAAIAADCGFKTSSHFNRKFLERMKTTPRSYRQQA